MSVDLTFAAEPLFRRKLRETVHLHPLAPLRRRAPHDPIEHCRGRPCGKKVFPKAGLFFLWMAAP